MSSSNGRRFDRRRSGMWVRWWILVASALVAQVRAPDAGKRFDPARQLPHEELGSKFLARDAYHCNCAFYGPQRAFVVYEKAATANGQKGGKWISVGSCSGAQGSYPEMTIRIGASRSSPHSLLIASWVLTPSGWTQERVREGFQSDDELNRHYWQWQPDVRQAPTNGAVARFYPEAGYKTPIVTAPTPKAISKPWPQVLDNETPKWGLLSITSGFYTNARSLNQPWNVYSASQFSRALSVYHPYFIAPLLQATPNQPLTARNVTEYLDRQSRAAKAQGVQFLVVYYIGHAAAARHDDEWLFMGDLDLADLRRLSGPLLSANVDLDAAPPGYVLPLASVARTINSAGMRFLLLVDACFDNEDFAIQKEFVQASRSLFSEITGEGDLAGVLGIGDEIGYFKKVKWYGETKNAYLSGNDPIVIASAPGTAAYRKPYPAKGNGEQWVGPLACAVLESPTTQRFDLGHLLRSIVGDAYGDPKAAPHTIPEGSVSWSSFSDWLRVAGRVRETWR